MIRVRKVINVEANLHDESRVIQRCFDDNKDDNKRWWQKAQRFKIESRTLQDSKGKLISRIKIQEIKIQDSRINNNQDQDSRLKIQELREDSIKISIKKFFKTLSSTWSFHKIITKEFYSLVIDYQIIVIYYQWF